MSPRRTAGTTNAAAVTVTLVAVVAIALGLMLLARAKPAPGPFDPRSSAADGLRGLQLLLEQYGGAVRSGDEVPAPGSAGRVLVVGTALDDEQRADLNAFVEAGGIAVIADASSPYQHAVDGDPAAPMVRSEATEHDIVRGLSGIFRSSVRPGDCSIGALTRLRGLAIERPTAFAVAPEAGSCFGDDDLAVVRATPNGAGTVVTIGDSALFTNRWLEYGDNAGLATALLTPTDDAVVTIVLGNGPRHAAVPERDGDERLIDLVRPSVWMGLAQLAVAFVVLAVAVGVRPGRVVAEPVPSPLEGSSLVSATGNLMQRSGHADHAARLLRYDVHRRLCARFGVSPAAPLAALERELTRRGLFAPGEVTDALSGPSPMTASELVALADRLAPLGELAGEAHGDPLAHLTADTSFAEPSDTEPPTPTVPTPTGPFTRT